jgi:hypothetical protein
MLRVEKDQNITISSLDNAVKCVKGGEMSVRKSA